MANLVYLPLIYLSGLFFPLPESIRWMALFSPAFHLNQLALGVAGVPSVLGASGPTMHVAALGGRDDPVRRPCRAESFPGAQSLRRAQRVTRP